MMRVRLLTGLFVALASLSTLVESASANNLLMEEILTGGAPRGRMPNSYGTLFGGSSSIGRTTVSFASHEAPGTIVINTAERRLYYVLGNGQALRYGIGVGRVGFTWGGVGSRGGGAPRGRAKREGRAGPPPWKRRRRRPALPRHMKGGPENPLGARAMYLGSSLFRIHGSNEPETIGTAVSSGCFRLTN